MGHQLKHSSVLAIRTNHISSRAMTSNSPPSIALLQSPTFLLRVPFPISRQLLQRQAGLAGWLELLYFLGLHLGHSERLAQRMLLRHQLQQGHR